MEHDEDETSRLACLEEIAYFNDGIDARALMEAADRSAKSDCGAYPRRIAREK